MTFIWSRTESEEDKARLKTLINHAFGALPLFGGGIILTNRSQSVQILFDEFLTRYQFADRKMTKSPPPSRSPRSGRNGTHLSVITGGRGESRLGVDKGSMRMTADNSSRIGALAFAGMQPIADGSLALQQSEPEEVDDEFIVLEEGAANNGNYVPDGEAVENFEPANDGDDDPNIEVDKPKHGSAVGLSRRFTPYHLGVAPFARFSPSVSLLARVVK